MLKSGSSPSGSACEVAAPAPAIAAADAKEQSLLTALETGETEFAAAKARYEDVSGQHRAMLQQLREIKQQQEALLNPPPPKGAKKAPKPTRAQKEQAAEITESIVQIEQDAEALQPTLEEHKLAARRAKQGLEQVASELAALRRRSFLFTTCEALLRETTDYSAAHQQGRAEARSSLDAAAAAASAEQRRLRQAEEGVARARTRRARDLKYSPVLNSAGMAEPALAVSAHAAWPGWRHPGARCAWTARVGSRVIAVPRPPPHRPPPQPACGATASMPSRSASSREARCATRHAADALAAAEEAAVRATVEVLRRAMGERMGEVEALLRTWHVGTSQAVPVAELHNALGALQVDGYSRPVLHTLLRQLSGEAAGSVTAGAAINVATGAANGVVAAAATATDAVDLAALWQWTRFASASLAHGHRSASAPCQTCRSAAAGTGVHHRPAPLLSLPRRTSHATGATADGASADRRALAALREVLHMHLGRVAHLFIEWGQNGDGLISKEEMRRALAAQCVACDVPTLDALFASLDRDGIALDTSQSARTRDQP